MNFEKITIRQSITERGGGIEIDLSSLGFEGEKMTAYQNYLGGGMCGSISNDCTMDDVQINESGRADEIYDLFEGLCRYYFTLWYGEWDSLVYKQVQARSLSAY